MTCGTTTILPHVEIKVESLYGIRHLQSRYLRDHANDMDESYRDDPNTPTYPSVTATVAFSGSARNMQVRSSMLCVETGLLMVESEALYLPLLSSSNNSTSTTGAAIMVPETHDEDDSGGRGSNGNSNNGAQKYHFTWPSNDDQPHLVISDIVMSSHCTPQSSFHPTATTTPGSTSTDAGQGTDCSGITASNHDRQYLPESALQPQPALRLSQPVEPAETNCGPQYQSPNATWSDDTPDILEFTVRVGEDRGLAFLVFSGTLCSDVVWLDLPIRRPATTIATSTTQNVFTDESRLRLMVRLSAPTSGKLAIDGVDDSTPSTKDDLPLSVATSTSSSSATSTDASEAKPAIPNAEPWDQNRQLVQQEPPQRNPQPTAVDPYPMVAPTKSTLEAQIGPLLRKIQLQEQEAWELHRARKANNLVVSLHRPTTGPQESSRRQSFRAFCAAAYWNWESIRELINACHGATSYSNTATTAAEATASPTSGGGAAAHRAGQRDYDFDACDSSTIGTHDSWELP